MTAMQLWSNMLGINSEKFMRFEILLFEAEIFTNICDEVKLFFKAQRKEFFELMKYSPEIESSMLERDFLRLMIFDILATGEYNMEGIAFYANTHEDVVQEVVAGLNVNPSASLLQRIIALHRSVRKDLYQMIIKKIMTSLSA
jgi:hypothetical protein